MIIFLVELPLLIVDQSFSLLNASCLPSPLMGEGAVGGE
jgi:hypothetical protein